MVKQRFLSRNQRRKASIAAPQSDWGTLGQTLQQALRQHWLESQSLQVRCAIRGETLFVLAEHLLHIEPEPEATFISLEAAVRDLLPDALLAEEIPTGQLPDQLPVQLLLRISGYQQPYASKVFHYRPLLLDQKFSYQFAPKPIPESLAPQPVASSPEVSILSSEAHIVHSEVAITSEVASEIVETATATEVKEAEIAEPEIAEPEIMASETIVSETINSAIAHSTTLTPENVENIETVAEIVAPETLDSEIVESNIRTFESEIDRAAVIELEHADPIQIEFSAVDALQSEPEISELESIEAEVVTLEPEIKPEGLVLEVPKPEVDRLKINSLELTEPEDEIVVPIVELVVEQVEIEQVEIEQVETEATSQKLISEIVEAEIVETVEAELALETVTLLDSPVATPEPILVDVLVETDVEAEQQSAEQQATDQNERVLEQTENANLIEQTESIEQEIEHLESANFQIEAVSNFAEVKTLAKSAGIAELIPGDAVEETPSVVLTEDKSVNTEAVSRSLDNSSDNNRRFRWTASSLGLASAVGGFVLVSGLYVLTRPCVIGSCKPLEQARLLSQTAIQTAQTTDSALAVVEAYRQLNEASYLLATIPAWSRQYNSAQTLLNSYEDQAVVLGKVVKALEQANTAAQKSQNPPHPLPEWREIQWLWREVIAQLEQIPPDSALYPLVQRKLQEYRDNLTGINQRVGTEQRAQDQINVARQAGQLAEARAGAAQTATQWQETAATWTTAIAQLRQIPQHTMAHDEAQQLLAIYQPNLTQATARQTQELAASKAYTQALDAAKQARTLEQQNQWSQAAARWQSALTYARQIPPNSGYYNQIQPLIESYTQTLQQAGQNAQRAVAIQTVQPSLEQACPNAGKICTYTLSPQAIRVQFTSTYDQTVSLTLNHQQPAGGSTILEQVNGSLRTLAEIGEATQIPVELYDAKGTTLGIYTPSLSGYVPQ